MVPPTSIWTGAVYLDAAATQGIPEILVLLNVTRLFRTLDPVTDATGDEQDVLLL